jgi:ribosomal protein L12E/L44/L45/RPP1/RPP2
MPTWVNRLQELFPGPKKTRALDEAISAAWELANRAKLGEFDSHMADNMMYHANDVLLGGNDSDIDTERQAAVVESRLLWRREVVSRKIIKLWTDFGFGQTITIIPRDPKGKKVWDEFWAAKRNRPIISPSRIHTLSNRTLRDGEFFFLFFIDRSTGAVTTRTLSCSQVTQLVHVVNDKDVILYYRREWDDETKGREHKVLYYRDWLAEDDAVEELLKEARPADFVDAAEVNEGTDVLCMQIAYEPEELDYDAGVSRGFPLLTTGAPWARVYWHFLQDRAAVSKMVATFVDEITVKGGSRAVDAVKSQISSTLTNLAAAGYEQNPVPTAGSTNIHNEAVTKNRLPLSTGAGDAKEDGGMFLGQAGLAGGVYAHWLGQGDAYRLATATAMETPVLRQWTRYQAFWQQVWKDVVKVVLDAHNKYGGGKIKNFDVDVTLDPLREVDAQATAVTLEKMLASKLIPLDVARRKALESLNVSDIDQVIADMEAEEAQQPESEAPATPTEAPAAENPATEAPEAGDGDEVPEPSPEDAAVAEMFRALGVDGGEDALIRLLAVQYLEDAERKRHEQV